MNGAIEESKCQRCGDPHPLIRCPYVKAIEFQDGDFQTITRIEFLTPADYGRPVVPKTDEEPANDYPKLGSRA